MKERVLERYLLREVFAAWGAVILVLLSIMVATRFTSFLSMAAKGDLPRDLLLQVVGLSSLRYLVILMPASLLIGIMLSLGRLYSDNEIAAMMGCGISLGGLYRPFLLVGGLLAAVTAALSFEVGPWAGRQADFLIKDAKRFVQYTPFEPARFKSVAGGRAVFYTSDVDNTGGKLGEVFAQVEGRDGTSFITAPSGHQSVDPATGERLVTLENGWRYEGSPGQAQFDITRYETLTMRVSPPPLAYVNSQRKLESTAELLGSDALEDKAELHWRLGAPISVLVLVLLAVPLSHLQPRQGRYSKVLFGLLAFLIYANLLGVGQAWIAKSRTAALFGLWWVHGLMALTAAVLIAQRRGWRWRS